MISCAFTLQGLFLTLAPAGALASEGGPEARVVPDPRAPCTAEVSSPVTYDVEFRFVVTPPHDSKQLRVWVPIPPSDRTQTVTGSELDSWPMPVKPSIADEPVHGNRFAYFEFDQPKGAQMIRHCFQVTTNELRWNLDPLDVQTVQAWPASFDPYFRSEEQSVVVDDSVRRKALEIVHASGRRESTAMGDVGGLVQWISANLVYDHSRASLQASSRWALENGAGHCSDYHSLCAAFGRALGYPTRVTYGIHPFPKNSPSHCKAEVYLHPHGWVSFDLSETQRLAKAIEANKDLDPARKQALIAAANRRLMSGFRDNTWFLQTRGSDYELVPPASRRVAVVRTIYAEADGEPLPEPDPGDETRREFAWMTLHSYKTDRSVPYPFKDLATLEEWLPEKSR